METNFDDVFLKEYNDIMHRKLGFVSIMGSEDVLLNDFMEIMNITGSDWTNTWRSLVNITIPTTEEEILQPETPIMEGFLNFLLSQSATVDYLKFRYKPTMPTQLYQILMVLIEFVIGNYL